MEAGTLGIAALRSAFWLVERLALRYPACPACPACQCPPLSVALTCSGTASTVTSVPAPAEGGWVGIFVVGLLVGLLAPRLPGALLCGQRWVQRTWPPRDKPFGDEPQVADLRADPDAFLQL